MEFYFGMKPYYEQNKAVFHPDFFVRCYIFGDTVEKCVLKWEEFESKALFNQVMRSQAPFIIEWVEKSPHYAFRYAQVFEGEIDALGKVNQLKKLGRVGIYFNHK